MTNRYCFLIFIETLRKYPPVDNLIRMASNDYKIQNSNLVIEKDTLIFIPVFGIHYNAEIYEDPGKFDPERFTPENKKNRHPMAHLPFGEGPRNVSSHYQMLRLLFYIVNLNFSALACDLD